MVITLDKRKKPLGTCTERRARILIGKGRACVYRYFPFTIIIKDKDIRKERPYGTYKIKIDPGAKYTGIAIVRNEDDAVVYYQQIEHRGEQVVSNMKTRNQSRRNRRNRETRYRRPKWGNKQIAKGKKRISMIHLVRKDGFHHQNVPLATTSSILSENCVVCSILQNVLSRQSDLIHSSWIIPISKVNNISMANSKDMKYENIC